MATKIRLQRQGRKRRPLFHIVVADSRAPRDGKYIERLGLYNPNTNPATIDLNFDRSLHWLQVGAQPSDTAKAILSYKGVLHKDFLINGVKKGAHTLEQAEEKFTQWLETKESKITSKVDTLATAREAKAKANLEREIKMKEAMAAKVLAKNSPLADEVAETTEEGTESMDETSVEVSNEATEIAEDVVEQPTAEIAEETVEAEADTVEEVVEETTEEVATETAESEETTPEQEA
jgi:small subunit ribosomal protein S16